MASVWPATLQELINESGFGLATGATADESEMDYGLPKKRRRFTKGIDTFSCTIDMDRDLYPILDNFFNTTLNGGVGTFLYDHPMTSVESEFQFIGEPTYNPLGGRYFRVSMTWRLIP